MINCEILDYIEIVHDLIILDGENYFLHGFIQSKQKVMQMKFFWDKMKENWTEFDGTSLENIVLD